MGRQLAIIYRSMMAALLYLSMTTRSDVLYAVGL